MKKIGAGRSAEVFQDRDGAGRAMVRKVFTGDPLSKVVLVLLTGSANPYTWCRAAMVTAVLRRQILSILVGYWFGPRLRLPRGQGHAWNEEHRAFELRSELIDGRHLPLHGPDPEAVDLLPELYGQVMRPLQGHLAAAGFDGLVWQAGRGNPVAANNFMVEGEPGDHTWVWIDLESGVPALFAMNPLATLGYYLPRSWRHGRWLFDDVHVPTLRGYLSDHGAELEQALGADAVRELLQATDELERSQDQWRGIPRHVRAITYERSRGRLSEDQAAYFEAHPWRWYVHLVAGALPRLAAHVPPLVRKVWRKLEPYVRPTRLLRFAWRLAVSQRYRAHISRRVVLRRLRSWRRRRFLDADEHRELRSQLRHEEVSAYLTDFGMHLAIKPFVKPVQWFLLPALLASGAISVATAALLVVSGGSIARTLYTGGRMAQAWTRGMRPPWIALAIGLLPVVGNAAYPAQLLYCSTESTGGVARFILYDALGTMGRAIPIWGGSDSLLEHGFNRVGNLGVNLLAKPIR